MDGKFSQLISLGSSVVSDRWYFFGVNFLSQKAKIPYEIKKFHRKTHADKTELCTSEMSWDTTHLMDGAVSFIKKHTVILEYFNIKE